MPSKKKKRVEIRPWPDTEAMWLSTFRKKSVVPKYSVLEHVTENDEWCAEAYLEPAYSELKEDDFVSWMREYVLSAFRLQTDKEADDEQDDDDEVES